MSIIPPKDKDPDMYVDGPNIPSDLDPADYKIITHDKWLTDLVNKFLGFNEGEGKWFKYKSNKKEDYEK